MLQTEADKQWAQEIAPALIEFIKVPAKSPEFDPQWAEHGYIDQVVGDAISWAKRQQVQGLQIEVLRLKNAAGSPRTPLIFWEVPAFNSSSPQTVLMYGHLDKQPEFSGWSEGQGPWVPKIIDEKLYGRGGADDGYAIYTSIAIVKMLQKLGASHPRIVGMFETCEESGSYDLPAYMETLHERMGDVGMVVCLDSGAGDYERLWLTNSLRGMASGVLKVEVLTQGVHSGDASGVVPSSMRIMRELLDRLENSQTGELRLPAFKAQVPPRRQREAQDAARILGETIIRRFPWASGGNGKPVQAVTGEALQALLNRTWGATMSVTGVDGIPAFESAGNVLRPYTAFKLSFRLPPTTNGDAVIAQVKETLERDVPYNAQVTFTPDMPGSGWNLPDFAPWLDQAVQRASQTFYGKPCAFMGEGGSIPLINMLQQQFPAAQMLVCGVLGPGSNAHGPNEFLHLPYARKLTAAVAMVLAAHP